MLYSLDRAILRALFRHVSLDVGILSFVFEILKKKKKNEVRTKKNLLIIAISFFRNGKRGNVSTVSKIQPLVDEL